MGANLQFEFLFRRPVCVSINCDVSLEQPFVLLLRRSIVWEMPRGRLFQTYPCKNIGSAILEKDFMGLFGRQAVEQTIVVRIPLYKAPPIDINDHTLCSILAS